MMPQEVQESYDLIIIGAGPAGLEAALQARKRGFSFLLIDKHDAGSLIARTMANKKFFHVYGRNTAALLGDLSFPDRAIGEELVTLWKQQVSGFPFRTGVTVRGIERDGGFFSIDTDEGKFSAQRVILTSGTFEHPRELGVPGEKGNPRLAYFLDYYNDYEGKKIVVVGGGNSALETVAYCAPNNDVLHIVRSDALASSITPKNRGDYDALVQGGKVRVLYGAVIDRIGEDSISVRRSAEIAEYPYDLIFVHAGFTRPAEFLSRAGIRCEEGKPMFNLETFETETTDLFIAGSLTGADSVIESANQAYKIVASFPAVS